MDAAGYFLKTSFRDGIILKNHSSSGREQTIEKKGEEKKVMRDFALRQGRQFTAIGVTLVLLLVLVMLYKNPGYLGIFSKDTVFAFQSILIAAFIGFSAVNWRCPSCGKYLGSNINRRGCRHCGVRLR